jgi:two-component system CheB/CheR fusion protein
MTIDSAEMGTWSMDTETFEFNPSQRLKEIFGFYPDEEMSYEAAIGQITPDYRALVTETITSAIKEGRKCDIEYSLRGFHDGKLRWVRAIGNITNSRKGKPTYFTGTLIDITPHKQDEIRKNDFIAMVSHELKTPLTSLQGYVQLLTNKSRTAGDIMAVGMLERAHKQVRKMISLVNGFLTISHLESGKIALNLQAFDISDLVSETVEEAAETAAKHNIVVHECPSLFVNADRNKIGQVIANILSNAIKYSPQGKNIEVSCAEINGMLQVSVKDEGMGIKAEDQDKLFDRYYRIEDVNTTGVSGFGLGLYLSAEIIQRHRGRVWVESELGKGSTFYFNLPIASV